MLCTQCERSAREGPRRSLFAVPEATDEGERLGPIVCGRCGGLLPAVDLTGTMLGKLSQLARFGLVDGSPPLFEPVAASRSLPHLAEDA